MQRAIAILSRHSFKLRAQKQNQRDGGRGSFTVARLHHRHCSRRISDYDAQTGHLDTKHLLKNRIHSKVVSERLGHSKIGITLDTYSHSAAVDATGAADASDAALGGA